MSRAVMQRALEALVTCCAEEWRTLNNFGMKQVYDEKKVNAAIAVLHEALAEPEQEPVAWRYRGNLHEFDPSDWAEGPVTPLYTAPTPRKPLSEEEIVRLMVGEDRARLLSAGEFAEGAVRELVESARAIERAHGIGEQT